MPEIKPAEVIQTIKARTATNAPSQQASSSETPVTTQVPNPVTPESAPVAQGAPPEQIKLEERARKEKEFFKNQRALQQKERAIKEREEKLKPALDVMELAAKGNVLEALEKAGISYDAFTEAKLAREQPTLEQIAEAKAKEIIEKELATLKTEREKEQLAENERILTQTRRQLTRDVTDVVKGNEAFPLINAFGDFQTIADSIEMSFEETQGEFVPIETAAKEFEDFLFEAVSGIVKLEPIQKKLGLLPSQQASGQPVPRTTTSQLKNQ